MKYAAYYWLFEPLRGGLKDSPERLPAFSAEVTVNDYRYKVAVLADSGGAPEAARVIIAGIAEEQLPERVLAPLQLLKEHLLSTMRLTYREDVQFFPLAAWSFFEEGTPYDINFHISEGQACTLDAEKAKEFFLASLPFRHEVKLLVDGNDPRIPIQHRYLSLYKLLEHEFKVKGDWRANDLSNFIAPYEVAFQRLGHRGSPERHLHELRDKCAHIRTGRSKELLGVNSLNHKATKAVSDMLPILRDMCRDLLNRKCVQAFQLGDLRPWYERVEA